MVSLAKRNPEVSLPKKISMRGMAFTELDNWLSRLPDDILVMILSWLTMKEAARTSILSRRWRYLWTFSYGSLDFDGSKMVHDMCFRIIKRSLEVERRRFINWVNRVLKVHQGPTITEFKVSFDLTEEHGKHDIDGWIIFALKKRVKRLELDFTSSKGYCLCRFYTLTTRFLQSYCLDSLTALNLNCVEVTGEVLEYVLTNCPFLEVLHVKNSKSLVRFRVPSALVKLKHLKITVCNSLEHMEICGVNLVLFHFVGWNVNLSFKDVPNLVEAFIGGNVACNLVNNISQFSSFLSRLETLVLDMKYKTSERFPGFLKSCNLKQLELMLYGWGIDSLLLCISILKACPMLHKFTLKIYTLDESFIPGKVKLKKMKRPHNCLKVVKIVDFVGRTADMEFALYVLNNFASLEKMTIAPRSRSTDHPDMKLAAITRAKLLKAAVPPGVEFVML